MGRDSDPLVMADGSDRKVRIEFARPPLPEHDLGAIESIERASFDRPWSRDSFERELRHEAARVFLARAPDSAAVVAYLCRRCVDDELQILNLAVSPHQRRCGLGRRLLAKVIEEATATGRKVVLEVESTNTSALGLYGSSGFCLIGSRKSFYGLGRDGLILEFGGAPSRGGVSR